jgi:hypothetical protein
LRNTRLPLGNPAARQREAVNDQTSLILNPPPAVATMDALLNLDAPETNHICTSIEDLALELAHLRETKVTDTKADRISATFEFGSTVVFNVAENENDAEPGQNTDQSAGDTPGAAPPAPMNGSASTPATREIRAVDALLNQPADDPALQKLVAKHIIACMGSADGSSWTVRSVSRNSSGWTFTYLCKNSSQAWMRQHSKHSVKLRIAESSGKDGQDPITLCKRKAITTQDLDLMDEQLADQAAQHGLPLTVVARSQ